MMRIKNLYSQDPKKRFDATIKFTKAQPLLKELWPRGCSGAPNGWLMLVGPSPGKADSIKNFSKGGPKRPIDKVVKIGDGVGEFSFKTGKQRNHRWNKLAQSVFTNKEYAATLTSRTNLDWGNYPDSTEIPEKNLEDGCAVVYGLMKNSQPRVIIVLSRLAWKHLTKYLEFCIIEQIFDNTIHKYIIQIPNCHFKTLLLKSPQHPSQPFFTDLHCNEIGLAVRSFLTNNK